MGKILYFKSCSDRKKAEELLKDAWPEVSFIEMRIDSNCIYEEELIHFGKWDIDLRKEKIFYNMEEISISKEQWAILEFLIRNLDLSFSIREVAYALNISESKAEICVADLLKIIEKTGSPIIQKIEERYLFKEVID